MNNINSPYDLAVIIPHYNDSENLQNALAELYKQQKVRLEIIIIDDASTKSCKNVIDEWQRNFSDLMFYKMPEKSGTLKCRLKGMEFASAPYVAFMDADDLLNGELSYATALHPYAHDNFDIIHFNTLVRNKWGFYSFNEFFEPISEKPLYGKNIFSHWVEKNCTAHTVWNKFYSLSLCKKVLAMNHCIKINRIEDFYLSIYFFLLAQSYLPVPDAVYKYQAPVAKSLEKSAARTLDCLHMYLQLPDILKEYEKDDELLKRFREVVRMLLTLNGAKMCQFLTDNSDHELNEKKLLQISEYGTYDEIFLVMAIANGSNANKLKDIAKILRYAW